MLGCGGEKYGTCDPGRAQRGVFTCQRLRHRYEGAVELLAYLRTTTLF
jgi:hypothetical protein